MWKLVFRLQNIILCIGGVHDIDIEIFVLTLSVSSNIVVLAPILRQYWHVHTRGGQVIWQCVFQVKYRGQVKYIWLDTYLTWFFLLHYLTWPVFDLKYFSGYLTWPIFDLRKNSGYLTWHVFDLRKNSGFLTWHIFDLTTISSYFTWPLFDLNKIQGYLTWLEKVLIGHP